MPTGDAAGNWSNDSTYAGDGNSETVLSMKFNYTGDYNGNNAGNRTIVMFGMRTGGTIWIIFRTMFPIRSLSPLPKASTLTASSVRTMKRCGRSLLPMSAMS